ncbi:hypothetical protein DH2020_036441 [Rehmannia glutinosa]|uniref:Exocyst subunit Exo70 family protein n=1 Tax=Rehmannia glutinosa TaxID=99300 RepID=A0ABR0V609_REHGL
MDKSIEKLASARKLLKSSVEKSKALALSLEKTGPRLDEINQRLPSLEVAIRPIRAESDALSSVGGHINRAVVPAAAVLKVFDAIHGLEKSLSDPQFDLPGYLGVLKRLEEALRFWDITVVADSRFTSGLKNALMRLRELEDGEEKGRLDGGLLEAALERLENEFRRLLTENSVPLPMSSPTLSEQACIAPSPLPVAVIQKLQAILGRLIANDRLEKCISIYVEAGMLAFLQFGKTVTESKKDPVKLLKLLDIFASLNKLRLDFNRLFGGAACADIQNLTRDLIKRVIEGACEIFWELLVQVELQRHTPPPPDCSIPRVVTFITDYCNKLLGDEYKPILTQVLVIERSWKHEKYQDRILIGELLNLVKAIELNLETWSKGYEDAVSSYLFLMNNHWHLYKHLKGTKLGGLLGDSWLNEHEQYKEYYLTIYLRESWGKLPALLSREGLILFSGGRATARNLVKQRLKAFNEAFDEMYKKQANWVIMDKDLREKTCQIIIQTIVPVYRSYMQNYGPLVEQDSSA